MKCIFHTGQCASSLLTTLLGTVNHHTYNEPSWTHDLIKKNLFPNSYAPFEGEEHKEHIVKFPSGLCATAHLSSRQKVFIYRKYQDHVYRHIQKGEEWPDIQYFYEYETSHLHPLLSNVKVASGFEKLSLYWANDVLWMQEASNVIWIDTNDFCKNFESHTAEVCEFFGIPPVTDFSMAHWDVKIAGLKGSDQPLKLIDIESSRMVRRNPRNGAVHPVFRDSHKRVAELTEWFKSELSDEAYQRLEAHI